MSPSKITEFMWDPIWYSPYNVLAHVHKIKKAATHSFKSCKAYRKIIEAEAAAHMLVCIAAASKKDFWMQIVDDKLGSPDIKTICYADSSHPKLDFLEVQDVEVVQYEEHAAEGLIPFIERTKFSKKKAYDQTTHILCHLGDLTTVNLPSTETLAQEIAGSRIRCPVLFLGSPVGHAPSVFDLIQLYPTLRGVARFDIEEEFRKNSPIKFGVMHFERGVRREWIRREEEKHYPFENLGLIPDSSGDYVIESIT